MISRIATLKNRWRDKGYTVFGGVLFTRSDREDIKELKDLKSKTFMAVDETSQGFPFLLSTRLYPEWPIARLRHVPEELSEKVAIALMGMPSDSIAAKSSESSGWTIPLDYHPVHELMKELRVGP